MSSWNWSWSWRKTPTWFVFNEVCARPMKKEERKLLTMQIWYFRNSVSWEWAGSSQGREVGETGKTGIRLANVVHCGRDSSPIVSCHTIQNIVCQNDVVVVALIVVFCACCIIFQIVSQLKWFEPPLNSCESCHRKQFTIPKGPSHNQMCPYNLSNCPAQLWFLIWQSIDSSFGKHKQTLTENCTENIK